ncbi:hypothetical protein [Mesorhizobium wenxiniae]|uniref:Uncharacterized protein n=1 Tax=Mesorhizobium wenxiniae TaxID=2014805 RepID=A0A271KHZ3_9HYPH|nr:hypothetical protein [Mesorhizobium wenxiniae]PAP95441.1 hypothetical protein CIT31_15695 [Mesorhizobium wenxiniae]
MIELALLAARHELGERADGRFMQMFDYCRVHAISMLSAGPHIGCASVIPVVHHRGERFDFAARGNEAVDAVVVEALGTDEERVIDLVAWRLDRPDRPLTMFGRVGLLGLSAALNPATFFMGAALQVHDTPLGWLKSACRGCAIVVPDVAARQLRDVGGPIAASSLAQGRRIRALIDSVPRPAILVPERRAA